MSNQWKKVAWISLFFGLVALLFVALWKWLAFILCDNIGISWTLIIFFIILNIFMFGPNYFMLEENQ